MIEASEPTVSSLNQGDSRAAYDAVRQGGAGLIDLSARGRIRLSGSEAVPFLNGLITNDVKALAPGTWMTAAFPNVQGRLLAAIRVLNHGDHFLIDTEEVTHTKVWQLLERFTLAGDFHVTDLTSQTSLISIQGAAARTVIASKLGNAAAEVERNKITEGKTAAGIDVSVIRATHTGEEGFDLFLADPDASRVWESLIEAKAQAVGSEVLEVLRIEAGVARYGIDMDESNIVSETNLDEAVSFTKGCYVGQEIIARIKYRGHVAKKLTGLIFENGLEVKPGAKILAAGKDAGRITSVTYSPALGRPIALGYVKYDFLAPGTNVTVMQDEAEATAQVTELPLVRGGWYQDAAS